MHNSRVILDRALHMVFLLLEVRLKKLGIVSSKEDKKWPHNRLTSQEINGRNPMVDQDPSQHKEIQDKEMMAAV